MRIRHTNFFEGILHNCTNAGKEGCLQRTVDFKGEGEEEGGQ
jgi:hypothetical protein